jgi:hypothetical protein
MSNRPDSHNGWVSAFIGPLYLSVDTNNLPDGGGAILRDTLLSEPGIVFPLAVLNSQVVCKGNSSSRQL